MRAFLFVAIWLCNISIFAQNNYRSGAEIVDIVTIANPFEKDIALQTKQKSKQPKLEPTFRLDAIFDNSAMVNDNWIGVDEEIEGYKVININKNSVAIQKADQIKVLRLFQEGGFR